MAEVRRPGLASGLAARIAEEIRSGRLAPGAHLPAQALADRFGVSRSPVAAALSRLAEAGLVGRRVRRGYFVAARARADGPAVLGPVTCDPIEAAYHAMAEDRLDGRLPGTVSANLLRERYGLTLGQVRRLVARVTGEGWVERRPGYGLRFTAMLDSADALIQTYRVRMAIEPAALLEPGYRLNPAEARECRRVEEAMLAGGIETMTAEALYDRGVRFHELLVAGSRNPFFLDALRRINGIRRLLAYRSSAARGRYHQQAREHLEILDLVEAGRNEEASWRMRAHLGTVIHNLAAIRPVLEPRGRG